MLTHFWGNSAWGQATQDLSRDGNSDSMYTAVAHLVLSSRNKAVTLTAVSRLLRPKEPIKAPGSNQASWAASKAFKGGPGVETSRNGELRVNSSQPLWGNMHIRQFAGLAVNSIFGMSVGGPRRS